MPWYRTGSVAITAGQTAVTGAGTDFAANARAGDGFAGPDGRWYEVVNVASPTVLSIRPAYQGATVNGGAYAVVPVQGYSKTLADAVNQVVQQWGGTLASLGSVASENIVPVAKGGTGAATAAAARANLGVVGIGDYGLGSYAARLSAAAAEDFLLGSGFYEVQPMSAAEWPSSPFPNAWTRFINLRHNNPLGYMTQIATSFDLRPRMKLRSCSAGSWGEWAEVYSQISILGTVGQSSGVPTGAIIERGYNANGQYTKYADGTLIQWGVYTHAVDIPIATANSAGGYRSAQIQVPFPTLFASRATSEAMPIAFSCYVQNNGSGIRAYPADDSSTVVGQFVLQTSGTSTTANAGALKLRWMAVGRWY